MRDQLSLLQMWYSRVAVTQYAHYLSATRASRFRYGLGAPAALLSTLVGTSVFATLKSQPDLLVQICVGLGSVGAALLSSLVTIMGYAERAEKHRIAGAKYGVVGRRLEQLILTDEPMSVEILNSIRDRMEKLALESPNIPLGTFRKAGGKDLKVLDPDLIDTNTP
ncbi:SLATT domain-containing protein [Achromobacter aloeverae]